MKEENPPPICSMKPYVIYMLSCDFMLFPSPVTHKYLK